MRPKPPRGRGSIIVISAPSGSGKSTLVKRLMASVPGLAFSVSHTTRPRRKGEKEGRDYFFVTRQRFEKMIAAGEFVEWADVFGCFYGTSRRQIDSALKAGLDVILDIDVQGHQQVRRRLPEALSVFVMPPSFQELERRLRDRHADSPQVIERRLGAARQEISRWPEYDYLIVNDRLVPATQALRAVVQAARFRRQNQAERRSRNLQDVWRIERMDLPRNIDSKFRYILVAAKRARQLQAGARPLIQSSAKRLTKVAQQEVGEGLVPFELLAPAEGGNDKDKKQKK